MTKNGLLLWIIAGGTTIVGLISLIIVIGVVYSAVHNGSVNTTLSNWGGILVGFFVGSFFNFVKVALDVVDRGDSTLKQPDGK